MSIRDITGPYIYDNTLLGSLINGAQLKDYLEYSAAYFNRLAPGAPLDLGTLTNAVRNGQPIPDYNYDQLSGVEYDIDIAQPAGSRIVGLTYAGRPVGPDRQFVLAVNNYRQSGGGGFPHISTAPVVYNSQIEIRQALIDRASADGVIDPARLRVGNWRLVRAEAPVF